MQPLILITRPKGEAERTAEAVAQSWPEVPCLISSLQRIEMLNVPPLPQAVQAIFTSRNGVRAWLAAGHAAAGRTAWCVGDATARAAQAAGFTACSAGGTVEDLLEQLLTHRPEAPLVHLRGALHRGDLVTRLTAGGLQARAITAYRQVPQPFSDAARAVMQQGHPVIAPLYSPATARLFAAGWSGPAPLLIAALSPAIAGIATDIAPRRLVTAAQPDSASLFRGMAGLVEQSHQLEAREGGV